jgi:hypothetical protein
MSKSITPKATLNPELLNIELNAIVAYECVIYGLRGGEGGEVQIIV